MVGLSLLANGGSEKRHSKNKGLLRQHKMLLILTFCGNSHAAALILRWISGFGRPSFTFYTIDGCVGDTSINDSPQSVCLTD